MTESNVSHLATKIKLLILDVDGVLTDGKIWLSPEGHELKCFHSQDGIGLKRLQKLGIKIAIISGRQSNAVLRRAEELQIEYVYQNQPDKLKALEELVQQCHIQLEQIAYIGDDLPDLPVMKKVVLPIAVNNAVKEVKDIAKWKTTKNGGDGAVREACEFIIKIYAKPQLVT